MKYLKVVYENSNYNVYLDDSLEVNTNLVVSDTNVKRLPYLLDKLYMGQNNSYPIYEFNTKDLSDGVNTSVNMTNTNAKYLNLKKLNGKVFLVNSSSRKVIDVYNNTSYDYDNIDYYDGYYYISRDDSIYRTTDFVTFDLYSTISISARKFIFYKNKLYVAKSGTRKIELYEVNGDTTTLVNTIDISYARSVSPSWMYICNGYLIILIEESNPYNIYMSAIKYSNDSWNNYVSLNYVTQQKYQETIYDSITEKVIVVSRDYTITFDTNTATFSYTTLDYYNNGTTPLYHTLEISALGEHFHITNPYGVKEGNKIVHNIDAYENDSYKIYVNADTDYKINSVTSSNGTITSTSDSVYEITYTNTDLYYTDSISVETEYAIKLLEGNYKMTFNSLTTEFESNESDLDNFAFVNHTIYPFKKMRFLDNKLSVLSGETWIDLMVNNTWVENSARYIVLSSELSGLTNQVVNGTQTLSNYYRGIIFNITENDSTYIARFDGLIYHITYDAYLERDVDNYIVIFEDSNDTLQYEFTALDGYKIQSITTNRGTVANNTVTILMSYFYNNMDLNINCITDYNDFGIILYKNNSDTKEMNKVLTNSLSVRGNLIEATSVEHPSIVFELNNGNDDIIPQYNYCYIPNFERYYFVEDKVNVGRNLWRLELRESDVLMSFKDDINATSGLITRNSNTYNDSLIDDLIPKKNELNITESSMSPATNKGFLLNLENVTYNIAVTISHASSHTDSAQVITPDTVGVNDVLPRLVNTKQYYGSTQTFILSNFTELENFMHFVNSHEGLSSYIINAFVYPFDLREDFNGTNHYGIVADGVACDYIGAEQGGTAVLHQLSMDAIMVLNVNYYKLATFKINRPTNYLDLKAKYEVFIPFLGWVELNGEQVFDKNIEIVYQVDLQSGENNVCLCDVTSNKLIYTAKCSLGISLPLTFDNSAEIQRQRDNLYISTLLGTISSASSLAFGVMTENPVALAGGVMGLGKTWTSYFMGMNSLFETAKANIGSGYSASYLPNNPRLRITKEIELYTNNESWRKLYGKPLMVIDTISNYSDYIEAQIEKVNIPNATNEEKNRIKQLFKDGIYKTI